MRHLIIGLGLIIAACSGAQSGQEASKSKENMNRFEPFPQADGDGDEGFCSIWREGEDGKAFFKSNGGSDGHVAMAYFGGETLTLRSTEAARFGTGLAILYTVDDYPSWQVSLKTAEGEFGSFAGTITMQRQEEGSFIALGDAISVEGLCAG